MIIFLCCRKIFFNIFRRTSPKTGPGKGNFVRIRYGGERILRTFVGEEEDKQVHARKKPPLEYPANHGKLPRVEWIDHFQSSQSVCAFRRQEELDADLRRFVSFVSRTGKLPGLPKLLIALFISFIKLCHLDFSWRHQCFREEKGSFRCCGRRRRRSY